jgi:hypothetical protein
MASNQYILSIVDHSIDYVNFLLPFRGLFKTNTKDLRKYGKIQKS